MWTEVAAIAFALVFLILGIFRTVEFSGLGLADSRRRMLIALHVLGCALFSSALVLVTIDTHVRHRTLAFALFVGALGALAPGQLTIAFRRK